MVEFYWKILKEYELSMEKNTVSNFKNPGGFTYAYKFFDTPPFKWKLIPILLSVSFP